MVSINDEKKGNNSKKIRHHKDPSTSEDVGFAIKRGYADKKPLFLPSQTDKNNPNLFFYMKLTSSTKTQRLPSVFPTSSTKTYCFIIHLPTSSTKTYGFR